MGRIKVQCELVTPLLMHGEDKNIPELRVPSIKGVMRFWWRAIFKHLDLEEMRKEEGKLFGNTKKRSSFDLKITSSNLREGRFKPVPHKGFRVSGFEAGGRFEMVFTGLDKEKLKTAYETFVIASVLGGFGQRSRRGYGSIRVVKVESEGIDVEKKYPIEKSEIVQWIKRLNRDINKLPKMDYPYLKKLILKGRYFSHYSSLLEQIGWATDKYPYFGFVRGGKKLASPVVVTINRHPRGYFPVITLLADPKKACRWKKFEEFKKIVFEGDILNPYSQ
ncbi:MAG: type III-B CRISPR module RAMP protein Cmr1 [Campylobacterales bacterium]